jgi:DNA-directed RNA polymerase subunit RPC12/RpoP
MPQKSNRATITCEFCGAQKTVRGFRANQRFCSRQCSGKAHVISDQYKCLDCGAQLAAKTSTRCKSCSVKYRHKVRNDNTQGPNPTGLCMCGCGRKTGIAKNSYSALGWVKGQPKKFCLGHHPRPDLPYSIDPVTGCWIPDSRPSLDAYGKRGVFGKQIGAHVWQYEQAKGPVPEGMVLDHLCRRPACINPDHLEPVTGTENVRRGNAAKVNVDIVRVIRFTERDTHYSIIANRYGIAESTVFAIRRGDTWKDVTA